ncbi:hypothetical protein E05_13970 [Plautia stali symbiont]|nr:hypothetical protein E05_13970 [Plautia stali symbiont]
MLSRTQPRRAGQPDLSLQQLQNPMIDAYLAALPSGVAPRILASRTAFVADSNDYARRLAGPGLQRQAEQFRKAGHDITGSTLTRATDITFQVHSIDPPHADTLRSVALIAEHIAPTLRALCAA